jgi:hypothetical protein
MGRSLIGVMALLPPSLLQRSVPAIPRSSRPGEQNTLDSSPRPLQKIQTEARLASKIVAPRCGFC